MLSTCPANMMFPASTHLYLSAAVGQLLRQSLVNSWLLRGTWPAPGTTAALYALLLLLLLLYCKGPLLVNSLLLRGTRLAPGTTAAWHKLLLLLGLASLLVWG
jgi:hypothetical protein